MSALVPVLGLISCVCVGTDDVTRESERGSLQSTFEDFGLRSLSEGRIFVYWVVKI